MYLGYVILYLKKCFLKFTYLSLQIPVYLSQALAENFYIFQYPVRPANRDWKDVKVRNAFIKPKNQIVRLEVDLDTYSDKYCPSKGEQIALNTDGQVILSFIIFCIIIIIQNLNFSFIFRYMSKVKSY